MKTIITLLTTAVLATGAITNVTSGASAAEQGSDEAANYALSWRAAGGFGGAHASARTVRGGRDFGAFASAREVGQFRNSFGIRPAYDFQLDGR
jgi:hypothetical protein